MLRLVVTSFVYSDAGCCDVVLFIATLDAVTSCDVMFMAAFDVVTSCDVICL